MSSTLRPFLLNRGVFNSCSSLEIALPNAGWVMDNKVAAVVKFSVSAIFWNNLIAVNSCVSP